MSTLFETALGQSLFPGAPAVFSPCRRYRYVLWRIWDQSKPYCCFIGLNPSTADETTDDNTVRRCTNFSKSWGYGSLCMLNLFSFRSTDPKGLKDEGGLNGIDNLYWILKCCKSAGIVVCAWGTHGAFKDRHRMTLEQLNANSFNAHHLGLTKNGYPKHPLYLRGDLRPTKWESEAKG